MLGSSVLRFGSLVMLSVEVETTMPRAAGQVNVGKWSSTTLTALGAARISTSTGSYDGVCQVALNGETRFYSSTTNATKFWGNVIAFA